MYDMMWLFFSWRRGVFFFDDAKEVGVVQKCGMPGSQAPRDAMGASCRVVRPLAICPHSAVVRFRCGICFSHDRDRSAMRARGDHEMEGGYNWGSFGVVPCSAMNGHVYNNMSCCGHFSGVGSQANGDLQVGGEREES